MSRDFLFCGNIQHAVTPFTENVLGEPRHSVCRGILLSLDINQAEIPRFASARDFSTSARNDGPKVFFGKLDQRTARLGHVEANTAKAEAVSLSGKRSLREQAMPAPRLFQKGVER